jgi:hypothetical protein
MLGANILSAIKNLQQLLKSIEPKLKQGEYVYCSVNEKTFEKLVISPLLMFNEDEGITLVIEKSQADSHSLEYEETWELVTLSVHSSLDAIGFIAAITQHLADYGLSTNVISAFYHDHLLVPFGTGKRVVELLRELQKAST